MRFCFLFLVLACIAAVALGNTNCPRERQRLSSDVSAVSIPAKGEKCTKAVNAKKGDRLFAKTYVSKDGKGKVGLEIRSAEKGAFSRKVEGGNKREEILDIAAHAEGAYLACVLNKGDKPFTARLTIDASDPAHCNRPGSHLDFCYQGVGANCDGVPILTPCDEDTELRTKCRVAIGSVMHDTCCSANPKGVMCGNGECPLTSTDPRGKNCGHPSNCQEEWNHAQNDVLTGRFWPKHFDRTVPTYHPSNAVAAWLNDFKDGAPVRGEKLDKSKHQVRAFLAPPGTKIWLGDAKNGWCLHEKSFRECKGIFNLKEAAYAVCCEDGRTDCKC